MSMAVAVLLVNTHAGVGAGFLNRQVCRGGTTLTSCVILIDETLDGASERGHRICPDALPWVTHP